MRDPLNSETLAVRRTQRVRETGSRPVRVAFRITRSPCTPAAPRGRIRPARKGTWRMSDEASEVSGDPEDAESVRGAVLVGVVPDLSPRVIKEAARYAML